MCDAKLKQIADTMSEGHDRKEYAQRVFGAILDSAEGVYEDRFVSCALPIANYAVDHSVLPARNLANEIENYVIKHTYIENGEMQIDVDEEMEQKYPIDDTMGSKLTALACDFVEKLK